MIILHIAAHVGGGIGAAYAGLGAYTALQETQGARHVQRIALLEQPQDLVTLDRVRRSGFELAICPDRPELIRMMAEADIVLINWSHHPAMTALLYDFPQVPVRCMAWIHVSGNYFPALNADFLRCFHQCVFATPFSLTLPQVQALGQTYIRDHFAVVYGLGDLGRFAQVTPRPHKGFTLGYVGTLNPCKLHPQFMDFAMAALAEVPQAQFVLAGDLAGSDALWAAAQAAGYGERITLLGRVDDVPALLSQLDVFGYILNSQHYGATENALLEAMAAGVPVVALDQCVERLIVAKGTGILVNSPGDFAQAVRRLHDNAGYRAELADGARRSVMARYDIEKNRRRMAERYQACMAQEKRVVSFRQVLGDTPGDWFLSAVQADRTCFTQGRAGEAGLIFHEKTKGSPAHYHKYFPQDGQLAAWARALGAAE